MEQTANPHWIDGLPAWDITLSNGEVHKSVTRREIQPALREMVRLGRISLYASYITSCVCRHHIEAYDQFHTEHHAIR